MQTKIMTRALSGTLGAAAMMALSVAAQAAAFEGRNATNAVDATCTNSGPNKCVSFYNATLDITILNNWNIGQGPWNAAAAPGSAQAIAAEAGFAATGLTGWVLPTGEPATQSGQYTGQYGSIMSQVGGRFIDLQYQFDGVDSRGAGYWSSTVVASNPSRAWAFVTIPGTMGGFWSFFETDHEAWTINAVAVRPGDVAAVPEPESYLLMLTGLGAIISLVRRSRAAAS
jgi:hypothetical protein